MAKYKAYPEYKKTSSLWVDVIPSHWMCILFKRVVSEIKDGTHGTHGRVELGRPLLSAKNVQNHGIEINESESFISEREYNEITRNGFPKKNDLLITCVGTIGRSCVYEFHEPIAFQRSVAFLRLSVDACPYFYKYYVESKPYQCQLEAASKASAQSGVYMGDLVNTLTVYPPINEQKGIVKFLHHETAKIDNLIEKQQQLIELLKEKRQAVISHAVTKGLNPDVPMKDSGVEWLGEIPEHWLCTKIKYIALLTPKKSSVNFKNNDECTFIPMEKLKRNSLVTDESKLIRDVISGYTYFEDDDLLLAKVTPCFENKNIAVARGLVNNIGFGSTEIYVLRPTEKIRVNYLLYRLQEDNFIRTATGAMTGAGGLKRVPSDFLLNYPIAIPPKPEMDAIVAYLNAQEVHYDLMEKNATQAVQLLQERRTALISAAVTGKIDVRDWVAPDTQNVEEPQEATA
ncbi:restriction endonuclease subunit S [Klebsiella pneumoniae]|uniref:restriction endonuclease subunit S n=1 Tax=Klebsiella pneumoniae TaxID=573 RepID=UPI0027316A9F|nr:restriction endonuclease subunit S [Klebsiella pneumoniae]MDP1164275.1 restriction endonuclease subunit S [Klebsiella pneumoniae]